MKRPLRILVAHNVFGKRTGGMSRLMGFVHDQLVLAGHSVDYFCSEDFPPALGGRFARFTFPVLLLRHAMAAARAGRPFDLINVHEPIGALGAAARGIAPGTGESKTAVTTAVPGYRALASAGRIVSCGSCFLLEHGGLHVPYFHAQNPRKQGDAHSLRG